MQNKMRKIMTIIGMTLMLVTVVGVNSISVIESNGIVLEEKIQDN